MIGRELRGGRPSCRPFEHPDAARDANGVLRRRQAIFAAERQREAAMCSTPWSLTPPPARRRQARARRLLEQRRWEASRPFSPSTDRAAISWTAGGAGGAAIGHHLSVLPLETGFRHETSPSSASTSSATGWRARALTGTRSHRSVGLASASGPCRSRHWALCRARHHRSRRRAA